MGGEEVIPEETQGLSLTAGQEERILVFVRLRPLNEKEYARNDVSDWECINNNSIVFKNSLLERSVYPPAYTFGMQMLCVMNFVICMSIFSVDLILIFILNCIPNSIFSFEFHKLKGVVAQFRIFFISDQLFDL